MTVTVPGFGRGKVGNRVTTDEIIVGLGWGWGGGGMRRGFDAIWP